MKLIAFILLTFSLLSGAQANDLYMTEASEPGFDLAALGRPCSGSYYNWGRGRNGFGYCYQYACTGATLNGGQPVSNYSCEAVRPSYVDWGRGQNGWGYCYQYTPYGVSMNEGKPVSNYSCEAVRRSYYAWGRGVNGQTYCYQYTAKGVAMNEGKPVSNYNCM